GLNVSLESVTGANSFAKVNDGTTNSTTTNWAPRAAIGGLRPVHPGSAAVPPRRSSPGDNAGRGVHRQFRQIRPVADAGGLARRLRPHGPRQGPAALARPTPSRR